MKIPQIDLFPDDSEDRAVSPVIGVILMVAITVILAAVIGTFVLNLSGSVKQQASAGVTVDANASSTVAVTVTSLGDKTDQVYCVGSSGVNTTAGFANNVGETLACGFGENVVAGSGDQDVENKTIKTDIGN